MFMSFQEAITHKAAQSEIQLDRSLCHREAAFAAVAIQSRIHALKPGLLRFARNDVN